MTAYYNEHDKFAAVWLRELIKAGHIAQGVVDERSIEDVKPSDLCGFTQCHFFAGIGVWSHALRNAGWPDDRPVWTGSCPCQPFSAAGKRGGLADERHLWPAFYHLIRECKPPVLFGEQVSSKDGLAWFDTVQSDLEAAGYATAAVDLCSAGFGAPHIRQRLYFVGSAVDHSTNSRHNGAWERAGRSPSFAARFEQPSAAVGLAHDYDTRLEGRERVQECAAERPVRPRGLVNGFWRDAQWIPCRDEKFRPIESKSSPLATGIANRVGKLRGYGNALTAQVAQGFIESYLESTQ